MSWSGLVLVVALLVASGVTGQHRAERDAAVDCSVPVAAQWSVPDGGESAYSSVEGYTQRYRAFSQIRACGTLQGASRAEVEAELGLPSRPVETQTDGTSAAEYVIGREWGRDYTVMVIDFDRSGRVAAVRSAQA